MRRVALIFPPQGDPTMPAAAPGLLKAFVERELPDHRVTAIDANVEAYDFLLAPDTLAACARRVQDERQRLEREGHLEGVRLRYYRALARADLVGPFLARAIDDAKAVLRDRVRFHDPRCYRRASSIVCRALDLISAAHHPTRLEIGGFGMPYSTERLAEIEAAARATRFNPFVPYYDARLLPRLVALRPDVVALSLAYPTQIHQVFALASAVRRELPRTRIVLGGSLLPTLLPGLPGAPGFLAPFDAVLAYEGETGLVHVLRAFRDGAPWADAPGLVHADGHGVRVNPPRLLADLDALPEPDWSDTPLSLYLSPAPVLPLPLGRGCYWGRCAFCCQDETSLNQPRRKSVEALRRKLGAARRAGFEYVYMCDEGYDPEQLAALGDLIRREGLALQWSSDARFDRRWTRERLLRAARGGCVKLWFGLESYNDRVLRRMTKGVTTAQVPRILALCAEANILVHLYVLLSFPGETREEATNTLRFLAENREHVDTAAFNVFRLHQASPMYAHPARHAIRLSRDDSGRDLPHDQPYETLAGMSAAEAQALCEAVRAHPQTEALQAPHVLSKAHLLILAGRDRGYRGRLIAGTPETPAASPPLEPGEELRVAASVERRRFAARVFDEDEPSLGPPLYAYAPSRDRSVCLSQQMAALLDALEESRTVEAAAPAAGMSEAAARAAMAALVAAGLVERIAAHSPEGGR